MAFAFFYRHLNCASSRPNPIPESLYPRDPPAGSRRQLILVPPEALLKLALPTLCLLSSLSLELTKGSQSAVDTSRPSARNSSRHFFEAAHRFYMFSSLNNNKMTSSALPVSPLPQGKWVRSLPLLKLLSLNPQESCEALTSEGKDRASAFLGDPSFHTGHSMRRSGFSSYGSV